VRYRSTPRNATIAVRVTDREAARWRRLAEQLDVRVSEIIRETMRHHVLALERHAAAHAEEHGS
jgi:hypothetical protein